MTIGSTTVQCLPHCTIVPVFLLISLWIETGGCKRSERVISPVLFFLKNVFWINLAVASDHINLGINGASANMSTGAISNYQRFLDRATIAPAAVTEILAIPEIWEKRTYSILDLSKFQFANGGQFDAEFIGRGSTLLLSENPFSIDRFALSVINPKRD